MELPSLQKDHYREIDFTFSITHNGSSLYADLIDVGDMKESVYGFDDKGSNAFEYPSVAVQLDNRTGKYSLGNANCIFGESLEAESMTISLYDKLGEIYLMPPTTFDVVDVELRPDVATVTLVHGLRKVWSKRWNTDDHSREVDWNGLIHYGPYWSI